MESAPATSPAGLFRELLAKYKWKDRSMKKVTDLKEKYLKDESERTKGSGGCVSSVSRAQSYTTTVANLLKAAVSPAGPALIHGSISLTYMLESERCSLKQTIEENTSEIYNVQQTPFVNLEHNSAIRAYQGWQDTRLALALERSMMESVRKAPGKNGREKEMNKRARSFSRSLLKVKLRHAMRAECLSTVRVQYNDADKQRALSTFGSDTIVFSVITYRKMPADVQAELNGKKITEQQVIDVVMRGRKRYERYFASDDGLYNCERRMRTVPASSTFAYFDQAMYFERSVMPLVCEAAERGLSGADAVRHVFPISKNGDENQCQRAFGHWMLNEFGKLFGADFQAEYKYRIVGFAQDPAVRELCGELLKEVNHVLEEFEAILKEAIEPDRIIITKRARVAAAAAGVQEIAKKHVLLDEDGEELPDDIAVPASVLKDGLADSQKRTLAQLNEEIRAEAAEAVKKRAVSKRMAAKYPSKNASLWPMQFPPTTTLMKTVKSRSQVDAAAVIVKELGVCDELERSVLRRTALEVSVGGHLTQTATNATTAAVREAAAAARQKNDDETQWQRDVGVDSRRMLNEASTKPIPIAAVIQHANPTTGAVSLVEMADREYAQYRIEAYDAEETALGAVSTMNVADSLHRIKLVRSLGLCHVALAANVSRALQMAGIPSRADTETNHALVRSHALQARCEEFVADLVALAAVVKSL